LRGWGEREGAEWVGVRGWGQGGEITQALYAHMNNEIILKKDPTKSEKKKKKTAQKLYHTISLS
jgi:hypothetical protein